MHGYSRLSHTNRFPPFLPHPAFPEGLPPLQENSLPFPSQGTLTEFPLFQTLRIEDEDELRELLDFFLESVFGPAISMEVGRSKDPREGIPRIPGGGDWRLHPKVLLHDLCQGFNGINPLAHGIFFPRILKFSKGKILWAAGS